MPVYIRIALLVFSCVFIIGCGERMPSIRPTQHDSQSGPPYDNGRIIVAAVHAYTRDQSHYPRKLSDLIPKYFPQFRLQIGGCRPGIMQWKETLSFWKRMQTIRIIRWFSTTAAMINGITIISSQPYGCLQSRF